MPRRPHRPRIRQPVRPRPPRERDLSCAWCTSCKSPRTPLTRCHNPVALPRGGELRTTSRTADKYPRFGSLFDFLPWLNGHDQDGRPYPAAMVAWIVGSRWRTTVPSIPNPRRGKVEIGAQGRKSASRAALLPDRVVTVSYEIGLTQRRKAPFDEARRFHDPLGSH
jgi:hypothetical protein